MYFISFTYINEAVLAIKQLLLHTFQSLYRALAIDINYGWALPYSYEKTKVTLY